MKVFFKKIFLSLWIWVKKSYFVLKEEGLHATIINFILTAIVLTLVGFRLNSKFQERESARQREFEVFRFTLEKKDSTINFISSNLDLRYLNSVRVLANISSQDDWGKYMASVVQWNSNREQIRLNLVNYFSWEVAAQFIGETNDSNSKIPSTIYYKFVRLHNLLVQIRSGNTSKIKEAQDLLQEIQKQRDILLTTMLEDLKIDTRETSNFE